MKVFLVACVVLATLCGKRCSAQLTSQVATQLSREEKQLALELHNNLRASAQAADMRQLQWDDELANKAEEHAKGCVFESNANVVRSNGHRTGENLYFIRDSIAATLRTPAIVTAILGWSEGERDQQTQLFWSSTHLLGCGSYHCPRLAFPDGSRVSATYIVCNYDPSYIVGRDEFLPGPCSSSSCPSDASICVGFTASSSLIEASGQIATDGGQLCAASNTAPVVPDDDTPTPSPPTRRVWYTTPRFGSFGGGTRVTINGQGFSTNQFAGGNVVTFVSRDGQYRMPCDVISYSSATGKIVCDTRITPALGYSVFDMEITSNDGAGPQEVATCGGSCRFIYHNSLTPTIEMIEPLASTPGELVQLSGRLLTSEFQEFQESNEDPSVDYFTRILVGGMVCNPTDENGELYGAALTTSTRGYVTCRPTTENRIGSMNTTCILAIRGNTFISFSRNLIGLDNKFQPYTFQTHADILNVFPASGSTRGGTQISITLNTPIAEYSGNIKVLVGGVPCDGVTVEGNDTVKCITGVQPPRSTYYPGGRGLLREVWTGFSLLDGIEGRPRSEKTSPQERAYRDNDAPREFGEKNYFVQRFSGFFVPPLTSLYTFGLISDDHSRLYLSPNTSDEHKQLIAHAPQHTRRSWTFYSTQTAAPVLLEGGKAYYMEAISNQYSGPWYLGISAKIHNLSLNTYPFNGDNEVQMINISSTVVKEKHDIITGVLPAIRKIVISDLEDVDSMMICELSLNISDEVYSLTLELSAEYIAETLNDLQSIQRVGRVVVKKEDNRDETGVITFTIIFLTGFGVTESDIPELTVSSFPFPCGNASQTVRIEVVQELTIPESFKVGFNDGVPVPRFSSNLPLSVSSEEMEAEISNLFAWQCEITPLQRSVFYNATYEDGLGQDNTTSFCGHYSAKNPRTVWQSDDIDSTIKVTRNGYLCFAHQGNVPRLRAQTRFYSEVNFRFVQRNQDIDLRECNDWPVIQDYTSWQHTCINLQSCFTTVVEGIEHEVSRIQFDSTGNSFWIDEFTISRAQHSITQVAPPASPGSVTVNYVGVTGGLLEQPELRNASRPEREASGSGSNSQAGSDPSYMLIWGRYQVVYTTRECGNGMSLLQGLYHLDSQNARVDIQRTAVGTPPVSGTFGLSFGNQSIRDIPSDVSADTLKMLLENNFVDEGGFEVTSSGACDGRKWEVAWKTKGGDQPPMQATGEGLIGSQPQVNVERVVDGGVWLRPLRGDMLRLPEYDPQVEVIIDDIPSSCRGHNCTFNFLEEITPRVYSIEPYEGQGGTEITISGSNFTTAAGEVTVTIGGTGCNVLSANESHIICTAGEHSAGWYKLSVHIEGIGYAAVNESVCFRYLLSVDSVSPPVVSIGGGDRLVISGNGFINFVPFNVSEPFSSFPWFEFGIGLPDLTLDNLCPYLEGSFNFQFADTFADGTTQTLNLTRLDMDSMNGTNSDRFNASGNGQSFDAYRFQSLLQAFYTMLPASVEVGGAPCIIVSANRTRIECITTTAYQRDRTNLNVAVLTERVTLEDAVVFSVNESALIHTIDPLTGPTFGGTLLTIYGSNFLAESTDDSSVNVVIGGRDCRIQSVNDTHIQCFTSPHEPGVVSILVSTANGIAVFRPATASEQQNEPNSSGFTDGDILDASGIGDNDEDLPPFQLFRYELEITEIQPLTGSVLGGTSVTIFGLGFSSESTVVYIGNRRAAVVNVNATMIECNIPTSSQTHTVKFQNRGFRVDGYDLAWSTMELTIEVGDIVQWEWSVSFQGVELHLFQTASNVSIDQLPGGFQSERQSSGSYSNKFTEPGTYYYLTQLTSALMSPGEPIRGTIYVTDLQSSVAEIQVFVAGFEAVYNIAGTEDDSLSPLAKRSTHQSSSICSDPEQASNEPDVSQLDLQQSPSYAYSVCHTPTVSSVSPRDVTLATVITISGVGFSQTEAQNVVMFGQHRCNVVNSGESQIRCLLDGSNPPAFVELPLSLNVDGLGSAHVQRPAEATITVRPTITDVSPTQGSIQGGTDITILGTAFPSNGLQVWIGSYACAIKSNSYTQICCSSTGTNSNLELELNVTVFLNDSSKSAQCNITGGCMFEYSLAHTPNVNSVSPTTLRDPGTITLTVFGTGFSATPGENEVYVGQSACETVDSNSTHVTCELDSLPAGSYELSMRICTRASNCTQCQGNASSNQMLTSVGEVHAVVPSTGSIMGGTEITISGLGFYTNTQVSIGGSSCMVSLSNYTTVTCKTSAHQAGTHTITITSGGMSFPQTVSFEYALSSTPQVAEIIPSSGQQGQEATISGSGFSSLAEDNSVMIGGSECVASASTENTIQCTLGANFVGDHELVVSVSGMGDAMGDVDFSYLLEVDSISPTEGSLAGLNTMTVNGKGFNPNQISISVCGNLCQLSTNHPTLTEVECIVPPHSDIELAENDIEECNVIVESLGESQTMVNGYTFQQNLTAVVRKINRTRGGTQGGSRILIEGVGFTNTRAVNVTIAGAQCEVLEKDDEHIVCETGASGRTVRAQVLVYIEGKGYAMSRDVIFWYVDLWSSAFTWGGGPLPRAGDFVIIPQGQTLVLDVKTPVLAYLLIQGGELIFDDEQEDDAVELHTEGVLIVNGGKLQVGTEENPFQHRTQIVLYGNVLSTEIPVYGAKTLAVRQGVLDLHGRPLNVTWTKLRQTANPSDTTLYLQDSVDWEVGGTIVLAATSFSQRENEELKITAIDETGTVLSISPPLQYKHISIQQVIEGRDIDTSAEVGYLTRNVVVRGNINYDTVGQVESCDEEFRPGQFEVQTCFLGRFGAETVDDQFGSQIMIHAAEQNRGDVIGRLEYIEVTHAGQAFRLGRYPIHFHLNGNVSGSYVRGCGIHHTFNRAVTIHAVDYLLVEKNVAYNILGHAYFLEDGIEQHNIIQDNLGVFVRASSSLLNVDITPATFWIVNPNNIVRRNAAAGGTHFGFWYRLPQNPTGPSATGSVCPRNLPLEEFSNNTAHSFGWYGLWVFPHYAPRAGGGCNDQQHTPVVFENFLSWRNDRGVEFGEVGSLQLTGSILLDNKLAGFEVTELEAVWGENGPLIANTLIVGHSDISSDDATCTESGIKTPHSYFLTVSGVTFVNFDRPECYPIQACSHCKDLQGGFETRYERIRMVNSGSQLTKWQWEHEHIHRDLDGSLTGAQGPSLLIPSNDLLPPERCQHHPGSAFGSVNGSICDGTLQFGRFALFDPLPDSLEFTNANLSNEHGTVVLQYRQKRLLSTGAGYMSVVQLNRTYQLIWPEGQQFTNFSYSELFSGFLLDDYIILSQTFPRSLDMITIGGVTSAANSTALDDPATAEIGDWYIDENNTLFYIIKGRTNEPDNIPVTFSTSRCFYEDCTPPPPPTLPPPIPPGRPNVTYNWSDVTIWPGEQLPQAGDDVYINCSVYILVNTQVPRLGTVTICGGLEFLDTMNHVFEVDLIIVQGGRLVAGYPETPFVNTMRFVLHGSLSSPEFQFVNGPSLGAKAIGVFGELILHSRLRTHTWTKLAVTAMAGSNQITVTDSVDWQPDEEIVVTSTSFEARETEVFKIMSVSSTGTLITLNASLQNTHSGESQTVGSRSYSVRAEVGLLTRNIVIESGDRALTDDEAFGCRVLVSNFIDDESSQHYVGSAQIGGVEFRHCGQLGYTDSFDPRFALAFLNRGPISGYSTYVQNSSFHDGYNTAIGVFGTNGILLENNIIHSTVGPSVWVTGSHHIVNRNLASLAIFIGTYRNRNEPMSSLWTANFELTGAANLTLIGNVASGGAKAGFHTNGEECAAASDDPQIADNVAHSTLHGVHLGYRDGYASGCSKFSRYTLFSCYHYGLFSYGIAGIWVTEATLVNNFAGIFAHVIGPPSLSHVLGNKEVRIEDSLIVSASDEFDCSQDSVVPIISEHPLSNRGLRSPTRGHVGIVVPSFVSGRGHFPPQPWFSIISYPAVNGSTTIQNVAFVNFRQRCDTKKDVVLMTNPGSEDCIHPVHLKQIHFTDVSSDSKLFNHNPHLGSVNPSDCVDMDCDGLKHVLFRDEDGSFSEASGPRTFISKAEFEWGGDPRRGIGDYRIPRTMLTYANGSSINVDQIYPKKGVVRGNEFGSDSQCSFSEIWNMYHCAGLDHLMLILESLDADTEVRRLSPIGVGANGFIDLLNGPQDHGWCGGYTCQERISTFYGIVASNYSYTVGLTSTNPQNMALHLLHSSEFQVIVVGIIYTNPQRLDVYYGNTYVVPNNAEQAMDGNLMYMSGSPEEFLPTVSSSAGSNFYDRDLKRLYITVRGKMPYRIETIPVIQVSLTLQVTVDDFFGERLVQNLAFLLGIDQSRIRIVNVVRETVRRKRQTGTNSPGTTFDIEIGNPPPIASNETAAVTNTTSNDTTQEPQNATTVLTFEMLEEVATTVVEVIQTGELAEDLNTTVVSATIMEPEPPQEDPTGGVRATNTTGGLQPDDVGNDTSIPTYYDQQIMMEVEERNETAAIAFSIPTRLVIIQQPGGAVEGLVFTRPARVQMYDNNNRPIQTLGLRVPWVLTAAIRSGPGGAFLAEASANIVNGLADFTNLSVSHHGSYTIVFTVTYPSTADFSVVSEPFVAGRRQLELRVSTQPSNGNTTFRFFPYPAVQLVDSLTNEVVTEHTWRNRRWYVTADVQHHTTFDSLRSWNVPLVSGEAQFTEILVLVAGTYRILFTAVTEPITSQEELPQQVSSNTFTVSTLPVTRINVTYDEDFSTVLGSNEAMIEPFIMRFQDVFYSGYSTSIEIFNITVTEGSIVVSFFATTQQTADLAAFVQQVTSNFQALSFTFNGNALVPSNITQDPAYPIVFPTVSPATEDQLVLILATTIPSGTILFATILLIIVVILCQRHQRKNRVFKMHVKPTIANPAFEEHYVEHNGDRHAVHEDVESMDEFFLVPDHKLQDLETQSFEEHEMANLYSVEPKREIVVSQEIKVRGNTTLVNPYASGNKVGKLDLANSLDEIWNRSDNANSNQNNNTSTDYDSQARMHLPNVVVHPEEESEFNSSSRHSGRAQSSKTPAAMNAEDAA